MAAYIRNFLACLILMLLVAIGMLAYNGRIGRLFRGPAATVAQNSAGANTQAVTASSQPDAGSQRREEVDPSDADAGSVANAVDASKPPLGRSPETPEPRGANPFVPPPESENFLITADDATDRVAAEMLDVLVDRPLLVVWLVDRTPSAEGLRSAVVTRLEQIYQKLAELRAAEHVAFAGREQPLMSVVGAFAKELTWITPEPTADETAVAQALLSITEDTGNQEGTFAAIDESATKFLKFRPAERRRLMIVVVTDEVGDDQDRLDTLVLRLRKEPVSLSVIGVAAPLGRSETLSPVVQIEAWQQVKQGPESLASELIDLEYIGISHGPDPIDSGFGPFALARLCKETGGRYWAVRHDRNPARVGPAVSAIRFDPQVMSRYAPDYVSLSGYETLLGENRARRALVEAARLPRVEVARTFKLEYVKKDEAGLKRSLDEGQRVAARTEPKLRTLYTALASGETDRPRLTGWRWQAQFDLAMGRILAARARVEGYNALLAQLKQGRNFPDPKHTTWVLRPAATIQGDSNLEKMIAQAHKYLERVTTEHPDTPWAMLAQRELQSPMGWEWTSR